MASEIQEGGPFSALIAPGVRVTQEHGRELDWGLGLGIVTDGDRRYVYHGGNNVIFIADFIYGVSENLGYAFLSNGANGQRVVDALEQRVFGRSIRR